MQEGSEICIEFNKKKKRFVLKVRIYTMKLTLISSYIHTIVLYFVFFIKLYTSYLKVYFLLCEKLNEKKNRPTKRTSHMN